MNILARTAVCISAAAIGVLSFAAPAMASVNPQAVNSGDYSQSGTRAWPPQVQVPPFQCTRWQLDGCYQVRGEYGYHRPYERRKLSVGYEFVTITSADGIHSRVTLSGTFSDYGTGISISGTQDTWTFPDGTLAVSYSEAPDYPIRNRYECIKSETLSGLYHITQGTGELEGWTGTGSFTADELVRLQPGSVNSTVLSYTMNGQGPVQDDLYRI